MTTKTKTQINQHQKINKPLSPKNKNKNEKKKKRKISFLAKSIF